MEKIDARKLPREALEYIRSQAFVLRQQGYSWVHIAEVVGVHVGTVLKWARRAGASGVDAVIQGGGTSQDSCRLIHATNCAMSSALTCSRTTASRSGLSPLGQDGCRLDRI